MDMRVFWAVLGALCVFGALLVVVSSVQQYRREVALHDAWSAVLQAANVPDRLGVGSAVAVRQVDTQRAYDSARRRLASAEDSRRRILTGNQRCVGGVVVQVDGSTYTQLGTISRPLRCSGGVADVPLR